MIPFRIGSPGQQIYGVYHAPEGRANGQAVLLCNPFGQEAVRIHRFYRVLAERLARNGIAALRFDAHGCGESDGEDEDGNLEQWVNDTLLANRELLLRSRAKSVVWVGARLATAVMSQASLRTERAPSCMVFWDPVTNGAAYLDQLSHDHSRELQRTLAHLPAPAAGTVRDEAIGFGLGERLRNEVAAVNAQQLAQVRTQRLVLITPSAQPAQAVATAAATTGCEVDQMSLDVDFDWTSEEALNTALVPAQALQLIIRLIEDAQP